MWVNKQLFNMIVADNKHQADELTHWQNTRHILQTKHDSALAQKSKDDVTIDWMRHRINALEKQNAQLMLKAAGILLPVPEIVPTRPGTISELPDFQFMPSFEDVGDNEAGRLGIAHENDGTLQFKD